MSNIITVLDPSSINRNDMKQFKAMTGRDFMTTFSERNVLDESGKVLRDETNRPVKEIQVTEDDIYTLAFLLNRKSNPDVTQEEVDEIPLAKFTWSSDDEDPKGPSSAKTN